MSNGLDCSARGGRIYHSPVAACEVSHFGQSYGFRLDSNHTYWMHCDSRTKCIDKCLTIDLQDIFYGNTKCAENESDGIDGKLMHRYFVPIHRGCESGTKLIFPADDQEHRVAAVFSIDDKFGDDDGVGVVRDGVDVYMRFPINIKMALCGFKLQVNTIDGRTLNLLISDIVSPEYVKTIPNEGLPMRENPSSRGDLHLCFKIEFPKMLSRPIKKDIANTLDRAQAVIRDLTV